MKTSKIRGFIKDLENKNKNFSFNKTMKLLDASNEIYIDIIKKQDFKNVTNYNNSKYLFKEITNELIEITELLNKGKTLMAVCLLRNVYEEIMYIMATSCSEEKIDIDVMTKAGYFKSIVAKESDKLFGGIYEAEYINELYGYLSKITHVTNMKEAISYLYSNKQTSKYINNEIKFIMLIIENIYITFLNIKTSVDNSMCSNIITISSYAELVNTMYFIAYSTGESKRIEKYFYGNNNRKYLEKNKEEIINDFKELQSNSNKLNKSMRNISKELDKQILENNYTEIIKSISIS